MYSFGNLKIQNLVHLSKNILVNLKLTVDKK